MSGVLRANECACDDDDDDDDDYYYYYTLHSLSAFLLAKSPLVILRIHVILWTRMIIV